jgi:hypothetical protein
MELFALERVATHQFSEVPRGVRRGPLPRAHFIEYDVRSRFSRLKSSFATRQASANNNNRFHLSILGTGVIGASECLSIGRC